MQRPKLFNSFITTSFLIAILGVYSLATPTDAYADTTSNDGKQLQDACFTLNSDPTWKELFINYSNAYSEKDYKKSARLYRCSQKNLRAIAKSQLRHRHDL